MDCKLTATNYPQWASSLPLLTCEGLFRWCAEGLKEECEGETWGLEWELQAFSGRYPSRLGPRIGFEGKLGRCQSETDGVAARSRTRIS